MFLNIDSFFPLSPSIFCFIFLHYCFFSHDDHLAGVRSLTLPVPLNSAQLRLLGKLNNLRIELL